MKCPYCGNPDTRVIDSRPAEDNSSIRRRRSCDECGKRFTTYAIRGEDHSGIISVNGGAAHQAEVGDIVIIATFGDFNEQEANAHQPRLVYANPDNTVNHTSNCIPVQVA